jgi:CheY-specific phosphatase CheX
MNFLGSADAHLASDNVRSMLNELANMICGAALTQLYAEGEFQLESPAAINRNPELLVCGQKIESDDGSMWVFFEIGQNKWNAQA